MAFGKLGGDHRGLVLDIPEDYIFGFTLHDLVPPSAGQLKMDNLAIVQGYNLILLCIIKKTGLDKELENLHSKCKYPMEPHVQHHFERVDTQLLEAQRKAEKKCAHIFAEQVEWSPQVKEAYELVDFWSMAVDRFHGRVINLRKLKKLCRRHNLIYPMDIKEARMGLHRAHQY